MNLSLAASVSALMLAQTHDGPVTVSVCTAVSLLVEGGLDMRLTKPGVHDTS